MHGGGPGGLGRNTWIKQPREEDGDTGEDGERLINIGGKATLWMGKGDRLLIETPGGGAWGADDEGAEGGEEGETEGQWAKKVGAGVWEARGSLAERAAAQASF